MNIFVTEHPLEAIYEYVEQTYLSQQIGDVLLRCMEKEDIQPMQALVEEFILSEPHFLHFLRQIISHINAHHAHIEDKIHQLLVTLQGEWQKFGIDSVQFPQIILYALLPAEICLEMLALKGFNKEKAKVIYSTTIQKNRTQMIDLSDQLRMIKEIEIYLQDWLWGMAYETFHREYPLDPSRYRDKKPIF